MQLRLAAHIMDSEPHNLGLIALLLFVLYTALMLPRINRYMKARGRQDESGDSDSTEGTPAGVTSSTRGPTNLKSADFRNPKHKGSG
jgi:hypothetical protein